MSGNRRDFLKASAALGGARETMAFYKTQTRERQAPLRAGLTPKREKDVVAAWHAKQRP